MPWTKVNGHDDCDSGEISVVKESDGAVEGCHATEEDANDQIAALEASEEDRAVSDIDLTPPESMQNAAQAALDAKSRLSDEIGECGTGVGERRARQIIGDEVGPDVIEKIAAYLTSHEEDVTANGAPTGWSDEEWTDGCGNVQYALWGGLGTSTGLSWAQRKANEVAREKGEDEPYPNRNAVTMDRADAADLSSGTLVAWGPSNARRHGEVVEVHTDGSVTSDSGADDETTMEASEDNPVVEIQNWQFSDGEWSETDITTVHRPDTLEIIDELPSRSVRNTRSYQSRVVDPEIRATADGKITVMVTTDDIARDGMVLEPDGLRIDDYMRNPVVLWEHGKHPQGESTPIGRTPNLTRKDNGYLATVEFDEGDPFAAEIKRKVEEGYINAVSIGWRTENIQREQRNGETVPVVTEADMTEFSFVGVPADTNALVQNRMHEVPGPMHSEFDVVVQGLMALESVRRMDEGTTYKQARRQVKSEIDDAVSGGIDAMVFPACPFDDSAMPGQEFENVASVLNADASMLMRAAEVDGCMYETQDDTERTTGEDTSSSPSASDGTPDDAERDESPGYITRSDAIRLLQEVAPQLTEARQRKAKRKAQKQLGIR